jgi:glucose/arabinose dehydrogenase
MGVLDPAPITGLPLGIESDRRDTAGMDIALHPRFAENRLIYAAYWKAQPGNAKLRTAILVRGRYDGGNSLADVREIFASNTWTDGPSATRIVFGRDGKIYMTIGTPLSQGTDRYPFVSLASWAQDPAQHAGQGSPFERRWERARRQSIYRPRRVQARDLRPWHSERHRADRSPRDRRALGNR